MSDIINDLLPEIEKVLSGKLAYTDVGADVVGLAFIEPQTTRLIGSDVGYADLELPTKDFRAIVIKWLEFLENHLIKKILKYRLFDFKYWPQYKYLKN